LAREQSVLRAAVVGVLPGITDEAVAGGSHPQGEPASHWSDDLLKLDRGALSVGPECLGLDPGPRQAGQRVPDVLTQQLGPAQTVRREMSVGPRIHVGDAPLVVAADERLV